MIIKKELKWLVVCVELMIPIFQKWYMNGNWREEVIEEDLKCLKDGAYIRLEEF